MAHRLTFRRRLSHNTKSNRMMVSKTPGGKLIYLYVKKLGTTPKCDYCKMKMDVTAARPIRWMSVSRRQKNVSRSYRGSRCHLCVRNRIVRTFLIEEQEIVVHVMKAKEGTKK